MKTKLKSIIVAVALCVPLFITPTQAQEIGQLPPKLASNWLFKALDFLATNQELLETNKQWSFVPYLSRAEGLKDSTGDDAEWGGGLAILYPINDYIKGGVRGQYFAGQWFMPSVNIQLASSYHLAGTKAVLTPMLGAGIASPIGGSTENGEVGSLYLAGLSLKYPISDKWTIGFGYAVETWSNLDVDHVEHLSIFAVARF